MAETIKRDRAGEFTESLCALEWIAEQLVVNEQYGPGVSIKAITERLSQYNEILDLVQDGAVDGAKPDRVFEQINEWLRQ